MSNGIESRFKNFSIERVVWIIATLVIIYASVTGTNWYNNYHSYKEIADAVEDGAMAKVKAYDALDTQIQVLQGELRDKNAAIEQLKEQTLR